MNFEDEDYRRLYVRKTVTYKRLGWEGRAVMHEMLYEFDRAGAFDLSGAPPEEAVELVTGLPLEVVQAGLSRLLKTQTWVVESDRLVWPSFVRAQNCRRSARLRKRESRQKGGQESVTDGHSEEHEVTDGHSEEHEVTPNLTKPSQAKPNQAQPRSESSSSRTNPDSTTTDSSIPRPVREIFDAWRNKLGHPRARLDGKRRRVLTARLKEHPLEELLRVLDGVLQSDWHMGRDPKTSGKRYDGIEVIYRDAAQVERFLDIADGRQSGRASQLRAVPQLRRSPVEDHENLLRAQAARIERLRAEEAGSQ